MRYTSNNEGLVIDNSEGARGSVVCECYGPKYKENAHRIALAMSASDACGLENGELEDLASGWVLGEVAS